MTRVLLGLLAAFAAVVLASCEFPSLTIPGPEIDASFAQVGTGRIAEMPVDDSTQSGIDYKLIVVRPPEDVDFMLKVWPGTETSPDIEVWTD